MHSIHIQCCRVASCLLHGDLNKNAVLWECVGKNSGFLKKEIGKIYHQDLFHESSNILYNIFLVTFVNHTLSCVYLHYNYL